MPPVVNAVSPNGAPAGSDVHIFGSGLTGATSVHICGAPATFVVTGDTVISATVPAGALGRGDVDVTGPSGTGSRTNAFTRLYPGPWLQGPDVVARFSLESYQWSSPEVTVGSDLRPALVTDGSPPSLPEVVFRPSYRPMGRPFSRGIFLDVMVDHGGGTDPIAYGWDLVIVSFVADMGGALADPYTVASFLMPSPEPDWRGADAWWYEYDGTRPLDPTGTGDYDPPGARVSDEWTLEVTVEHDGGSWVDDVNHKDPADYWNTDMWASKLQARRMAADSYVATWDNEALGSTPDMLPGDMWPADDAFGAVLAEAQGVNAPTDLATLTNGGYPVGGGDNYLYSITSALATVDIPLTDADFDPGLKLGVLSTFDFESPAGLAAWPLPPFQAAGNPNDWPPYSNGVMAKQLVGSSGVTLSWTYRPPRFRFLYLQPQARPPLAHRQRKDGTDAAAAALTLRGPNPARPPLDWRQNTP